MTVDQPSFEEAFERLEDVVRRLESGGLPLEESITLYEEATSLASVCHRLLDSAELRVRQLQERTAEAGVTYPTGPDTGPSLLDRLQQGVALLVPCPHCGELIPTQSATCVYCGKPHTEEQRSS